MTYTRKVVLSQAVALIVLGLIVLVIGLARGYSKSTQLISSLESKGLIIHPENYLSGNELGLMDGIHQTIIKYPEESTVVFIFLACLVVSSSVYPVVISYRITEQKEDIEHLLSQANLASDFLNHEITNAVQDVLAGLEIYEMVELGEFNEGVETDEALSDALALLKRIESLDTVRKGIYQLMSLGKAVKKKTNLCNLFDMVLSTRQYAVKVTNELSGSTMCDPEQIMLLLDTLIRNADIHANAAVRVFSVKNGFCVEDEGGLFPPESFDRLIESGIKGEKSMGDGLGLYLVSVIAAKHSWSFSVKVVPQVSTRFNFTW